VSDRARPSKQPPGGGAAAPAPSIRYRSAVGRWVLVATVLGSGMASLDATVVSIALPAIGKDFDASFTSLQWTVNAYTLTLAGFLLLGGSLGDHYGRRRVFSIGVAWFAAASLLCAVAPDVETLIAARALEGVGAALLTPGSLAIIEASFDPDDRSAAVGAWSGLGGVASAIGPFLGGWLIDAATWRLIFLLNLPLAAAVLWVSARHVPETRDPGVQGEPLDLAGSALIAASLAGITYALTEGLQSGWGSTRVVVIGALGLVALAGFVRVERRSRHPMIPLSMFRSVQFSATNLVTFLIYGALGAAFFLLPIQLQISLGYSPLEAGAALIPLTVISLLLSARAGRLAQRIGPRIPMTLGPLVAAIGLVLISGIDSGSSFLGGVLPGVIVLGLGLSLTVAPLTSTVLVAGGEEHAGISSAINVDVARVAGLLAVALIPAAAGISGADYRNAADLTDGFMTGLLICAALSALGGVLAFVTVRRPAQPPAGVEAKPVAFCPVAGPPLGGTPAGAAGRP
jgi:EmrB/QacA subfamily drug resistance transporter